MTPLMVRFSYEFQIVAGDLNRVIVQSRFTLKALLRARAKRTVEAIWDTVGEIVALFKPQECANYFVACGYDPE
jgi:hypothetical protein